MAQIKEIIVIKLTPEMLHQFHNTIEILYGQ